MRKAASPSFVMNCRTFGVCSSCPMSTNAMWKSHSKLNMRGWGGHPPTRVNPCHNEVDYPPGPPHPRDL